MIDRTKCPNCGDDAPLSWYDNQRLCTECIDYARHSSKPYDVQQIPDSPQPRPPTQN